MAYYSIKKCGRCGYIIKPWGNENINLRFGNPIIECENCNAILIEKNIKEYIMFNQLDYVRYFAPQY